jgi:hypothetical protein
VAKDNKPSLDSILSSVHGIDYGRDRQCTKGELQAFNPEDGVVCWMNFKTFGIPDSSMGANPMFARCNFE